MKINLYSDTQSIPTEAMREAIARAPVGDEQKGTDPTVTNLLERVTSLLGKEAAIFLPTGTMCNAVAVATHCGRGDGLIAEANAHIMRYEAGGMASISGVLPKVIHGQDGQFSAADVLAHHDEGSRYTPRTTLLAVEQTCNLAGGTVWSVAALDEVAQQAKELGMKTHMDGARLFNAAVSTGVAAAEHCREYDSVWVDFTKGMGAPMGSVLCGSSEFIERAWHWKHRLGGALRQGGMMAAGCLYALDHYQDQLAQDHANARLFNEGLKNITHIKVRHAETQSNIVYFSLTGVKCTPSRFVELLAERGLKVGFVGDGLRAVTYNGITSDQINIALKLVREVASSLEAIN